MTDTSNPTTPAAPKPKWFLQSKTIWGMIAMVLPILLPMMGVSFNATDIGLVNSTVDQAFQVIGTVLVLYARFKDGTPLTATPPG